MNYDTDLSDDELTRAFARVAPDWTIETAAPTTGGHHAVYRLAVETPDGPRECYLKGTPEGKPSTVDTEARLLAALDAHTDVPVPTVYGVVDEGDSLPAPYAVLSSMPGEVRSRAEIVDLSERTHRAIAHETGRYLADLHALDAVDAYGFLTHDGPALDGDSPPADLDAIAVADPIEDWRDRLHDWADGTLADVRETRFADVVPEAEPVLRDRIDAVEGPFEPVLARIDQALENVLLDDGALTAMLDWEFTIAATPAYDLQCVAWSLAGGPYLFADGVPDRRDLVAESLLAGYRQRGADRIVEQYRVNRGCYELLSALRSMVHLVGWYELFDFEEQIDDAAAAVREEVDGRI